jgi:hypothetical protein
MTVCSALTLATALAGAPGCSRHAGTHSGASSPAAASSGDPSGLVVVGSYHGTVESSLVPEGAAASAAVSERHEARLLVGRNGPEEYVLHFTLEGQRRDCGIRVRRSSARSFAVVPGQLCAAGDGGARVEQTILDGALTLAESGLHFEMRARTALGADAGTAAARTDRFDGQRE